MHDRPTDMQVRRADQFESSVPGEVAHRLSGKSRD